MCGIAGSFNPFSRDLPATSAVDGALRRLARRGPDASGTFAGPGFVFGHRRLSIIDLAGGHQPLVDDQTGHVLAFNGEIYNYRDLRDQLKRRGCHFQTESDTEVLLHAWQVWGPDALSRLNGMFAFALYEPTRDALILARDHLGIKPLYYHRGGPVISFASSIAALTALPGVERELSLEAASHFLTTSRLNLGTQALLRDVFLVEPGTLVEVQRWYAGLPRIRRYWRLPVVAPEEKALLSVDEAAAGFRDLFEDAIRLQLVSDVPLGGFLSGGIDSAVIARAASRHQPFATYSVGYDDEPALPFAAHYHEWEGIRSTAAHLGLNSRERTLHFRDFTADWHFLVHENGLPLSTPNEVAIYRLARALREEFTVALSGEGADELLGGYILPYASAWDWERAQATSAAPDPQSPLARNLRALYGTDTFTSQLDHFLRLHHWLSQPRKARLFRSDAWEALADDRALVAHYGSLLEQTAPCSPFDRYLHLHARVNLEGLLLRLDSSCMAASVEGRVPFTDPRLAAYLFQMPDAHKIDWVDDAARARGAALNIQQIDEAGLVVSKILLRLAYAHELPGELLRRRKRSFPVPVKEWLSGPLLSWCRETVLGSRLPGRLLNEAACEALFTETATNGLGHHLWPLVNLALWVEDTDVQVESSPSSSSEKRTA